ncbi:hypothetical protein [Siccirubricoccus sp. G192]|uniref:hypothetical protein n=1 Tax=Siccirubricoccus sp. G192 TaxID=2849651 RepID=UPI001C2B9EA7|nr:hypothetical protein [Siccirubricoccus sp. G192]MBV1798005.1 hypothetical protein [Siccirubricoccus sp. G192]
MDGTPFRFPAGSSVLGGAAGGLSYEGALRDALAVEERDRRREAGRRREAPQAQPRRREPERRKPAA